MELLALPYFIADFDDPFLSTVSQNEVKKLTRAKPSHARGDSAIPSSMVAAIAALSVVGIADQASARSMEARATIIDWTEPVAIASAPTAQPAVASATQQEIYCVIAARGLNIRETPGGEIIDSLVPGTEVVLTPEESWQDGYSWGKLAGQPGWVAKTFLVSLTGQSAPSGTTGRFKVNVYGLNIRSAPDGAVTDSLTWGEEVTLTAERVLQNGHRWGRLANQSGWIATEFLTPASSTTAVPATTAPATTATPSTPASTSPTRYRVSVNTGLNIRATPGGEIIDSLVDGDRVTVTAEEVTAEGYRWVRLADRSGWVAKEFLVAIAPSQPAAPATVESTTPPTAAAPEPFIAPAPTTSSSPTSSPSATITNEQLFAQGRIAAIAANNTPIYERPSETSPEVDSLQRGNFVSYTRLIKLSDNQQWHYLPAYEGWVKQDDLRFID